MANISITKKGSPIFSVNDISPEGFFEKFGKRRFGIKIPNPSLSGLASPILQNPKIRILPNKPQLSIHKTVFKTKKLPRSGQKYSQSCQKLLKKSLSLKTCKSSQLNVSSLSPDISQKIEAFTETIENSSSFPNLPMKPKLVQFKNFNLSKELELTQKILNSAHSYKSGSILENFFTIKKQKKQRNGLEEKLKILTEVIGVCINRMNMKQKCAEGVLLDKVWKSALKTFDDFIGENVDFGLRNQSNLFLKMETPAFHVQETQKIQEYPSRVLMNAEEFNEDYIYARIENIQKCFDEFDKLYPPKNYEKTQQGAKSKKTLKKTQTNF